MKPTKASVSEIRAYLDCGRQWDYKYRLKVYPDETGTASGLGTDVHDRLERLALDDDWKPHNDPDYEHLVSIVTRRAIEAHPLWERDPIACEIEIPYEFDGVLFPTTLDWVGRDEAGVLHVLDYKTVKNLPQQGDPALDPQLALYAAAARRHFGETGPIMVGFIWAWSELGGVDLTKGSAKSAPRPSLQSRCDVFQYREACRQLGLKPVSNDLERFGTKSRCDSAFSTEMTERAIVAELVAVAREMRASPRVHANRRAKFCTYCKYRTACDAQTLGGDVDAALAQLVTPYQLEFV